MLTKVYPTTMFSDGMDRFRVECPKHGDLDKNLLYPEAESTAIAHDKEMHPRSYSLATT